MRVRSQSCSLIWLDFYISPDRLLRIEKNALQVFHAGIKCLQTNYLCRQYSLIVYIYFGLNYNYSFTFFKSIAICSVVKKSNCNNSVTCAQFHCALFTVRVYTRNNLESMLLDAARVLSDMSESITNHHLRSQPTLYTLHDPLCEEICESFNNTKHIILY